MIVEIWCRIQRSSRFAWTVFSDLLLQHTYVSQYCRSPNAIMYSFRINITLRFRSLAENQMDQISVIMALVQTTAQTDPDHEPTSRTEARLGPLHSLLTSQGTLRATRTRNQKKITKRRNVQCPATALNYECGTLPSSSTLKALIKPSTLSIANRVVGRKDDEGLLCSDSFSSL